MAGWQKQEERDLQGHDDGTNRGSRSTSARKAARILAGSYGQKLATKAGEVTLTVRKLRTLPFETAITKRNRPHEPTMMAQLLLERWDQQ